MNARTHEPPIKEPGSHADEHTLTLTASHLRKTYSLGRVDVPVLRGVSLDVREGEWVAILGKSGSGKSTLLHLLGGLDRPDTPTAGTLAPTITFAGEELTRMSASRIDRYRNQSVGFVFQFYHLLPELNVMENALVPAMVRFGRLGYRAQRGRLAEHAARLLEGFGLAHRLKHRPSELSGGERQRVAIARALINDPPVLLADEPTGNLDRATGQAILNELTEHRRASGRTIVMVTHDEEIAARADRVVRLVDGLVSSA